MSIGPDDPRQVGGRYWCGYWQQEYTVLGFVDFDDWRGRSITVRLVEHCTLHEPPCALKRVVTHATAWDPRCDRILAEPSPKRGNACLRTTIRGTELHATH